MIDVLCMGSVLVLVLTPFLVSMATTRIQERRETEAVFERWRRGR